MLKTYKPLRSKSGLKRKTKLDRGSTLRARSKSKRAVTKVSLTLCAVCHDFAHKSQAAFDYWLLTVKPGLKPYLKRLGRTEWFRKPLDEAAAAIRAAKKRTWREHWESLEVTS